MRTMVIRAFQCGILGTVALLLAGCSTGATTRTEAAGVAFSEVVLRSDHMQASLRTLHGEGDLRIETPSFSQSASFEVSLIKPDSLYLKISGPFGITVGSALVTRTTFQFYNSLQNRVYEGRTTPANIERALRVSLSFDDILALFTGGAVLSSDRSDPSMAEPDGSDAAFLFSKGTYQRRYVIDPETRNIRKLQFLNDKGAPVAEQAFSAYESRGDLSLPRTITVTQHETRRRLTLSYDGFEWNDPPRRLAFSVPSSAERIDLK